MMETFSFMIDIQGRRKQGPGFCGKKSCKWSCPIVKYMNLETNVPGKIWLLVQYWHWCCESSQLLSYWIWSMFHRKESMNVPVICLKIQGKEGHIL